jgi:hypothetical protein
MKDGEWAFYRSMGDGQKGDTIYLPAEFDPANLGHRGAAVHELQHASDDKAAAGPTPVFTARDRHELRAYRRQARFLLDTIEPLSGEDRRNAISDAATQWQQITAYAMALEARADLPAQGPILRSINAAASGGAISARDVTAALSEPEPKVEAFVLKLIQVGYKMTPATMLSLDDGLSGESLLDWIHRPAPAR